MIIPPGAVLGQAEERRQPSRTYRLDLDNNRIAGMIDGLEAVRQAVYMALSTERFAYFIYSANYGMERGTSGGAGPEWERWVKEALLADDRITGIEGFRLTASGDELELRFTVVSIYGSTQIERRLSSGV